MTIVEGFPAGCGIDSGVTAAPSPTPPPRSSLRFGTYRSRRVWEGRTLLGTVRGEPIAELRAPAVGHKHTAKLLKLPDKRVVILPREEIGRVQSTDSRSVPSHRCPVNRLILERRSFDTQETSMNLRTFLLSGSSTAALTAAFAQAPRSPAGPDQNQRSTREELVTALTEDKLKHAGLVVSPPRPQNRLPSCGSMALLQTSTTQAMLPSPGRWLLTATPSFWATLGCMTLAAC